MTLPTSKIKDRGFTIVELLIVIIVIGILATLVLIAYSNVQAQARDTKRQSNAASLRDASAGYKIASTTGYYPRNTTGGTDFQTDITTAANYTNSVASINVDQTVSTNISSTVTPSSSAPDTILVTYCGTGTPTYQTATGMKFTYYKENGSTTGSTSTGTGTGC